MFRAIRRSFIEGVRGMIKNGLMTITSIFVVTSCIFVFGVFMMSTLNINYMTSEMADNFQVDVYITRPENCDEASYEKIKNNIKNEIIKTDNVDTQDIGFVSGVKKFEDYKKTLAKDELTAFQGLPDNLISDSFTVKMTDLSKTDETTKSLLKINGVESVENSRELVEIIDSIKDIVKKVSVWIIVAFALVSLFIISNTIKLTVHNRRNEINIMKYVGATDSYIRGPFIMEGMLVGLISAIIAFFISMWTYEGLMTAISSKISSLTASLGLMEFSLIWTQIIGAYVILGCIIGAFGSFISVRRYLHV